MRHAVRVQNFKGGLYGLNFIAFPNICIIVGVPTRFDDQFVANPKRSEVIVFCLMVTSELLENKTEWFRFEAVPPAGTVMPYLCGFAPKYLFLCQSGDHKLDFPVPHLQPDIFS